MIIRNKLTGKTLEVESIPIKPTTQQNDSRLSSEQRYLRGFETRSAKAESDIAKRGSYWGNIAENLKSPNIIRKIIGGASAVGSPFATIEHTVAAPAFEMQRGQFNPLELAKAATKGFKGERQVEYGDIYRTAGAPGAVAAPAGLLLNLSPVKAVDLLTRPFRAISKLSDKGILRAGKNLMGASDEAIKYTGTKLGEAYGAVDDILVDPNTTSTFFKSIPKELKTVIAEDVGSINDLTKNMTIAKLRRVKQLLGKYRPSAYGRGERGLPENIAADKLNSVYSSMKNTIYNEAKKIKGEKAAEAIMNMDEAFTKLIHSTDYVKKTIVDPTLRMATKGGSAAKKLKTGGDVSFRTALNIIRQSGRPAKKAIDKALQDLNTFNKWQMISEGLTKAAQAATYGGAIGGVGGYAASKFYRNE